jgi:flavin-dependent dehydrogenase
VIGPDETRSVPSGGRETRVAILGGGPAGAFCAIWLCRLRDEPGRKMEIVVFDHKSFEKLGPAGCNMCAGVIPESLVRSMGELGMELPERVIQRRLRGCYLETKGGAINLRAPDDRCLYATFRGPGPLGVYPAAHEGFDWYLLEEARRIGIAHESRLVTDVSMPSDTGGRYEVACSDGFRMEADVVVGAFGVNSNLGGVFERLGFGYRAPDTLRARQAEMPVDPDSMPQPIRDRMVIFALGWPSIRYAAITPKRRHVTVTLIGQDPSRQDMEEFLDSPTVRRHFPPGWAPPERYCSCAPRLPTTAAANPVHDGLVVIGDAHTSRYLKNGIESSFYTAMWAAKVIAQGRTSAAELAKHYVGLCRRTYVRDNAYGRLLLRAHDMIAGSTVIARAHIEVAREEQGTARGGKSLTEVLWGTFTGSMPYRTILRKAASPRLQLRLARALVATALAGGTRSRPKPRATAGPVRRAGPSTGRIIVVGGGPAGAACAVRLARGRDGGSAPEIVLVEAKRFGEHQNQCAGVLSPPGDELVAEVLGEDLPAGLVQRRIKGYVFHGTKRSIELDGGEYGESPQVLRRVELDRLLLQRAKDVGVKVVHARATDLEVTSGGATLYTDGGSFEGDGVIGAFALDATMGHAFSLRTDYRAPASLETLACKIHPAGLDFIPGLLGDNIHVYLPKASRVDFGALTPKGNHIVVIIAGTHVTTRDMAHFLALPEVAERLPASGRRNGLFKGAFPLGPARGLYGDSYVVIGDAAGMVRPFKGKGINSAIEAGRTCAESVLSHGFSGEAFRMLAHSQRHLTGDVWYGRLVRRLVMLVSKHKLLDPVIEQAQNSRALRQALFDCISGRTSYRNVVLRAENLNWIPSALWRCTTWRSEAH